MNQPIQLIFVSIFFAAIPFFLSTVTSFLKINIVLGMIKNGLGTQNAPSNLIVGMLSLSLTAYIMRPVITEVSTKVSPQMLQAIQKDPSIDSFIQLSPAFEPLKKFLLKNSGKNELAFFHNTALEASRLDLKTLTGAGDQGVVAAETKAPQDIADSSMQENDWSTIVMSFVVTELKEAFSMGFLLLLPFLVIDITVALFLSGLGMYMVSPTTLTLPLKLLLFVGSDAWLYLIQGLLKSY